ncbi:MAG: hypothetical protein E7158_02285 [Firmicutes bacterium]|nr:hypothetical protein [Bacillota bacterium]
MNKIKKIIIGLLIGVVLIINHKLLVLPETEFNIEHNLQFYVDIVSKISFVIYTTLLFFKIDNKKICKVKKFYLIILDLFLLISNAFTKTGDLSYIYSNIKNILYTILFLILNYIVLKRTLILIENVIKNYKIKNSNNKFLTLLEDYPFMTSFIVIFLFFSIYMIAFYPIILSPDPSFQIKQFFNVRTKYADYAILLDKTIFLTNHHPVIHTLLLGYSLKLGKYLISDNFGLFIYSFIQSIFLISTLAYTIKYLKENKINKKILFLLLCIYCLVPMYAMYSMSAVKDTYYTCFIIWYVIFLDKLIRNKNKDLKIKTVILLIIDLIGLTLFRNNGIYVVSLSLPFAIIFSKTNLKKLLLVFLVVVSFYTTFDKVILPYYKITPGSIRETLSIPFQQTARYVKYYEKDLSKDEINKIDKVLKYKTLAKRYNPKISDPVKNKYNRYATSEDLKNYFKVWFKCFFRHPLVYIEATLHNTYGYFSPQDTNWYVYHKYDTRITEDNLVNYHYNKLDSLRLVLSSYGQGFPYLPFIGLISNIGFNTWILIGISMYLILKKKREYLIVLSPLFVSLLICVASPVNTYFRYTMPYIFIMPMILILFSKRIK